MCTQKKKLNDKAEKVINDNMLDDSIMQDLAGEAPRSCGQPMLDTQAIRGQ